MHFSVIDSVIMLITNLVLLIFSGSCLRLINSWILGGCLRLINSWILGGCLRLRITGCLSLIHSWIRTHSVQISRALLESHVDHRVVMGLIGERSEPHTYRTVGKNLRHIYIYVFYIYIYIYIYIYDRASCTCR